MSDERQDRANPERLSHGEAPPPPSRRRARRARRLSSLRHVRNGLAEVVRELEHGHRDPTTAKALIYAYSVLAGVIETNREQDDFGRRLAAVEATVAGRGIIHALGRAPAAARGGEGR
jgi:hypothetical protein